MLFVQEVHFFLVNGCSKMDKTSWTYGIKSVDIHLILHGSMHIHKDNTLHVVFIRYCSNELKRFISFCYIIAMVFKYDGSSNKCAQLWSDLGYLICLRQLIRSRAITYLTFFQKRAIFLHTCAACSELPSNIRTMGKDEIFWSIYPEVVF